MKVVVLFGGKSTEYGISCISAASVVRNIGLFDLVKIGITKEGFWYKTDATADEIENGSWILSETNLPVTIDLNVGAFLFGEERCVPDTVFPVLHGKNGEDGTVQGLLEIMGVKYVGCGVLSSALCMDKAYTKIIFAHAGLRQADWVTVSSFDYSAKRKSAIEHINSSLNYPLFVKPSSAGSSIGISLVNKPEGLPSAIENALLFDRRVVVETAIQEPYEAEVAVIGGEEPVASVSGGIVPDSVFYDYRAKYESNGSRLVIPSGFENEAELIETATKAYKACDCNGLARVDFLIEKTGEIYINEINTIPGFTAISMFPKLFEYTGLTYEKLTELLIKESTEEI